MRPKESDIIKAKEYLKERLSAERSMQNNLEYVMREAAERVVEICYNAKIDPAVASWDKLPSKVQIEIEEVVQWLKETIDDYFLTLAIYDHEENKDKIMPFVLGVNHGQTFNERLSDYCAKYRDELLLLVGAGLFLGIGEMALAKSIGSHLKQPYKNPDLVDGIAAEITYGRGKYNSMFNNINRLCCFGISSAWMRNQYIEDKEKGCIGWLVQRGSSYPCSLCDERVGFHTEDDYLPPFHANCCCYAVPVFL